MQVKMANRTTELVPTNYTMDQYPTCRSTLNTKLLNSIYYLHNIYKFTESFCRNIFQSFVHLGIMV